MGKRVVSVVQVLVWLPFRHPLVEYLDEILVIDMAVFCGEDLNVNLL